jgi:ribonuclease BN (tRNA processing enzyme)
LLVATDCFGACGSGRDRESFKSAAENSCNEFAHLAEKTMSKEQQDLPSEIGVPATGSRREGFSRRALLGTLGAAATVCIAAPPPAWAQPSQESAATLQAALRGAKGTKLVLLGTGGGPLPGQARAMTSHVMVHEDAAYILDCGLGVTSQFARTGMPFSQVRSLFITHHHPDHNIEFGPFLLIGWVHGLKQSAKAYGPPPLKEMTEGFLSAYRTTVDFWAEDFHVPPLRAIVVQEISEGGRVMSDGIVTVYSTLVEHPSVAPALGYRFDFPDRSIAFSGDTAPLAAVAEMAKGADILVHEAMNVPAIEAVLRRQIAAGSPGTVEGMMKHMLASHTPAEEAGRIAAEAGVKTLVLSHLVPGTAEVSDATWRDAAAKHFNGEIIVGHDLMVI